MIILADVCVAFTTESVIASLTQAITGSWSFLYALGTRLGLRLIRIWSNCMHAAVIFPNSFPVTFQTRVVITVLLPRLFGILTVSIISNTFIKVRLIKTVATQAVGFWLRWLPSAVSTLELNHFFPIAAVTHTVAGRWFLFTDFALELNHFFPIAAVTHTVTFSAVAVSACFLP